MLLPFQGVTNEPALTQGVASLALGYALIGLSARPLRLSWAMRSLGFTFPLRLPWAMRSLGFQPARFACPGLCAHWALPFRFAPVTVSSARALSAAPQQFKHA